MTHSPEHGVVATPAPQEHVMGDIALIREALSDPTIASYPDFTKAVSDAMAELERLRASAAEGGR